jgi:hypothetical protein
MRKTSRARSITRSTMRLFSTEKGVNPNKRYPSQYDDHYYLNEKLCDGIEQVAKIERMSKKEAVEMLATRGFSSYMGDKTKEQIQIDNTARELNQKIRTTRFILQLRRFARESGADTSKLFWPAVKRVVF